MTLLRRSVIRLMVDCACGLPAGYTSARPTAGWPGPAGKYCGPTVVTTPGVWLAVVTTVPKVALSAGLDSGATSCSGPLKPGPNPCTSISQPRYVVVVVLVGSTL